MNEDPQLKFVQNLEERLIAAGALDSLHPYLYCCISHSIAFALEADCQKILTKHYLHPIIIVFWANFCTAETVSCVEWPRNS